VCFVWFGSVSLWVMGLCHFRWLGLLWILWCCFSPSLFLCILLHMNNFS
jgi:hypothetical protein